MDRYKEIEEKLQYTFKDKELLKRALIHRSYGNENKEYMGINNEKLELLGDAVLDLVVTEYLYKKHKDLTEGELTKLKSMAISEPIFSKASQKVDLGKHLLLSKGESLTGGRERDSILGDLFEAILGAVYLDSDFYVARECGLKILDDLIGNIESNEELMDYKTIFQEYIQKKYKVTPSYRIKSEEGPDHMKTYVIEVCVEDKVYGTGSGKNKKVAEQGAAKDAYKKIEGNKNEKSL